MEWPTLLASAGVSAVVSAVVSLISVRQVTVRRARAERAEQARTALRTLVQPLIEELARYEYLKPREPRRDADTGHMEDHAHVTAIRAAARDLPAWRRWLIDRRCRRVFGDYWTELARTFPNPQGGSFGAWLASSLQDARRADSPSSGPTQGLMHRAYASPAGGDLTRQLRRELRRLAAGR